MTASGGAMGRTKPIYDLSGIQIHILNISLNKRMAQIEECSLCLEKIQAEDEIETRCGHKFHKECFMELTIKNRYDECPLCRRKFEEEWFLGLRNIFLVSINNDRSKLQMFDDNWNWWIEHFAENRQGQDAAENENENELDEWQEFLLPPRNDDERLEGFNLGARPREPVNPELVVWEGEIEDLFEEAAQMAENNRGIEIRQEDLEAINDFIRDNRDLNEE